MLFLFLLFALANACTLKNGTCINEDYSDNDNVCVFVPCDGCGRVEQKRDTIEDDWTNAALLENCTRDCAFKDISHHKTSCSWIWNGIRKDRATGTTKRAFKYAKCVARHASFVNCAGCEDPKSPTPPCGTEEKPYNCIDQGNFGYKCACKQTDGVFSYVSNRCLDTFTGITIFLFVLSGLVGVCVMGLGFRYIKHKRVNNQARQNRF